MYDELTVNSLGSYYFSFLLLYSCIALSVLENGEVSHNSMMFYCLNQCGIF